MALIIVLLFIVGILAFFTFLPTILSFIFDPINKYSIKKYFKKRDMPVNEIKVFPNHYSVFFIDNNGLAQKAKCRVIFGKIKWKGQTPE